MTLSPPDFCKTCKHWSRNHVDALEGWGICLMAQGESGTAVIPDTLAFAEDAEAYDASLHTSPDFYCNQFEVKP